MSQTQYLQTDAPVVLLKCPVFLKSNSDSIKLKTFPYFCTLCLNGVEEGELIEILEGRVPERGDGKRLQVQQLSGRWVLLWQDQVTEGHGQLSFTGFK